MTQTQGLTMKAEPHKVTRVTFGVTATDEPGAFRVTVHTETGDLIFEEVYATDEIRRCWEWFRTLIVERLK
jgi:hypothetical protein